MQSAHVEFAQAMKEHRVAFFTGAGISLDSCLPSVTDVITRTESSTFRQGGSTQSSVGLLVMMRAHMRNRVISPGCKTSNLNTSMVFCLALPETTGVVLKRGECFISRRRKHSCSKKRSMFLPRISLTW